MAVPRLASPPFDSDSADLIYRTCDNVDFRVHKCILAIASPLHNDASEAEGFIANFTELKDGEERRLVRTAIPVSEESEVMDKLLRLVYPVASPALETLDELKPVLEAAMKYQLEEATSFLRKKLVSDTLLTREPLRVFCIACYHGFEEETRIAAIRTCSQGLPGPRVRELSSITASATQALWELSDRAAGPAISVASNLAWLSGSTEVDRNWSFFLCQQCPQALGESVKLLDGTEEVNVHPRAWWKEYLRLVQGQLQQRPCGRTATSASILMSSIMCIHSQCVLCRVDGRGLRDLQAFSALLAAKVDKVVMEVAATIRFQ